MKLYNHPMAPNPRRVRIFAAEKGIRLQLEDIDLLGGQNRAPEFLKKESLGWGAGVGTRRWLLPFGIDRNLPLPGRTSPYLVAFLRTL